MRRLRSLIVAVVALAAASATAMAQRLFRSTDPVEVTFTTSLRQLIRERDSLKLAPHPALMTYKDSAGKEVNVPVTLLRSLPVCVSVMEIRWVEFATPRHHEMAANAPDASQAVGM